jgi:hypothetical protein
MLAWVISISWTSVVCDSATVFVDDEVDIDPILRARGITAVA